jgi:hypothetical protein
MTGEEAKAKVLGFLQRWPGLFAAAEDDDGKGAQLVERGTAKSLLIRWGDVQAAEEKSSPLRPHPYLVLLFQDGRQVALADVGFAFAPNTQNTGPIPELPATFCFRDLRHLVSGAQSIVEQPGREADALRAVMMGIALLDGARAAGFDTSREERSLEAILQDLERRGIA